MKVGLATEGTYPFHGGGVSVWCDQLVTGLHEHAFDVMAVCATGSEPVTWKLPRNVVGLHRLPLWLPVKSSRRGSRAARQEFAAAHRRFALALVDPDEAGAAGSFLDALRTMFDLRDLDLDAQQLSNESLGRLIDAWQEAARRRPGSRMQGVPMTFADALTATETISHFLRPLTYVPPKVDLVHAVSNGLAGLVGIVTKWTHGVPFALTEHGLYLRERYLNYLSVDESFPVRSLIMNFFRLLAAAVYGTADVIRPGSQYNQRWELRSGAEPERLQTIHNGVDPAHFTPDVGEPSVPTIAWLGRIDPLKDLHTLIHSFGRVVEEIPTARLRLFGGVPAGNEVYYRSCVQLVRDLRLARSVTFEGTVDSPATAYEAGHVFVLSSVSEGFPFTVIEAMASGKATVATDVGGVSEAVGDTGVIVQAGDTAAMARACIELLHDHDLRRSLGSRARSRVEERFSLQQSLAAYRDTYQGLLAIRPGRADATETAEHEASTSRRRVTRWTAQDAA